jgi:hypothetical protein
MIFRATQCGMSRVSRRRVALSLLAVIGALVGPLVVGASPASAEPSCPGSTAYDFNRQEWDPSNQSPQGVRAPIVLNADAVTCTGDDGFVWAYVAIDNIAGTKITQIGFRGDYDPSLGGTEYCKAWAINGGTPNFYGACSLQTNHQTFFKIHTTPGGSPTYNIDDCSGDQTYTTCTVENSAEAEYSNAYVFVAEETDYGRSACTVHIMGSSGNHLNIGTTDNNLQGQTSQSGAWDVRTFSYDAPICNDYNANPSNSHIGLWDTRN